MKTFSSVSSLARHYGCNSLAELGRHLYRKTSYGVNTIFLTMDDEIGYQDTHYGIARPLPNIWAGTKIVGIKFTTIVEGCDAEFEADPVFFPCEKSEIKDALNYLKERVAETVSMDEDFFNDYALTNA